MSQIKVAPFLHILHQSSPLLHWLLWCQGLIPLVCNLCPDCSLLWPCLWWHLLPPLLRDTNICLRLSLAFLLWPWHWVSPHQPSHHCSGQTTTSTTNASCYCHCDDYSSERELQCWPMTMKSFPQLTKLGNPLHLLNIMTSSLWQANWWHFMVRDWWTGLLPSMFWGLWNTASHLLLGLIN
jgi:hypothetical protein